MSVTGSVVQVGAVSGGLHLHPRNPHLASVGGAPPGRPLEQMTDPFALEVHRPVEVAGWAGRLPDLPPYVRREHDQALADVVRRAASGHSAIRVMVGGSSTGKTRACWEALSLLREQEPSWRLWHPFDPTRPEAALADLAQVGPNTVVWLNETQLYLITTSDVGERVAGALHTLLRDLARGPVLVLGTLWSEHWQALTVRPPADKPDPHAQARVVLAGSDLHVPPAFTDAQLRSLTSSPSADPRLAQAASAEGGHVAQYLAGAPALLARYRHAAPAARAVIQTAMDARRLGHGPGLPRGFLGCGAWLPERLGA